MTMISFSFVDLTSPRTWICLSAAYRKGCNSNPKQNKLNNDKKLDFSTGRVFVQRDKSENTKLSVLIKVHFEQLSLVDTGKASLSAAVRTGQ